MALYQCHYFKTASGRAPAREFIESLDPRSQRKFFFVLGLLEEFGHRLPAPHAKHLRDGIFELRFGAIEGDIRLLYFFFSGNQVILTNGFVKKSGKTPSRERRLAVERRGLFLKHKRQEETLS